MPSKHSSAHHIHRVFIGVDEIEETIAGSGSPGGSRHRATSARYEDGRRVHGRRAEHQPHPDVHVSLGDQDAILFESQHPFVVHFPSSPASLFYRPLPWASTRGRDGMHRVLSGPIDSNTNFLRPQGTELKFTVAIRRSDQDPQPEPTIEPLDPHVIVEP